MSEIRIGNGMYPPPSLGALEIGAPGFGAKGAKSADGAFGDILSKAVAEVNQLQKQADNAAEGLITGRETNLHGTLVALEKADVSFKLMMKVRDKIVDAYREVMKMGV